MNTSAISLQLLTHRLSECPSEFLAPREIQVGAVVWDTLREMGFAQSPHDMVFYDNDEMSENRLKIVLVACWLLGDDSFPMSPEYSDRAMAFLRDGLKDVAEIVKGAEFISDADRREELARMCLDALGLRPENESEEYARDRLTTLSSLERARVLRATQVAQKRAEDIREAMRQKSAAEAAAKYTRE